jgi:hypothetical protein
MKTKTNDPPPAPPTLRPSDPLKADFPEPEATPIGDKLDELQWRFATVVTPELLRYCSDGQYLIAVRINRGVMAVAASVTGVEGKSVVTVCGDEVSIATCCEFCARTAVYRHKGDASLFLCARCGQLNPDAELIQ